MANKIGSIEIEVKPTVTLESAYACLYMLNMFLVEHDEYSLSRDDGGDYQLIDEYRPPEKNGFALDLSEGDKEILDDMPNLRKLLEGMGARLE